MIFDFISPLTGVVCSCVCVYMYMSAFPQFLCIQLHFSQTLCVCVCVYSVCAYVCVYVCVCVFWLWLVFCCVWAFSTCSQQGLLFFAVCGFLTVVALVLWSTGFRPHGLQQLHIGVQQLQLVDSRVWAQQLWHTGYSSVARGIFLDQGSNPCPLHWQVDSEPQCHQGVLNYILDNII